MRPMAESKFCILRNDCITVQSVLHLVFCVSKPISMDYSWMLHDTAGWSNRTVWRRNNICIQIGLMFCKYQVLFKYLLLILFLVTFMAAAITRAIDLCICVHLYRSYLGWISQNRLSSASSHCTVFFFFSSLDGQYSALGSGTARPH